MLTPIDPMLNNIAVEHFQKSWHELDDEQKAELRGYVAKFGDEHFSYVKPKAGYFSNYAVEGTEEAATKTTRYIEDFTKGYCDFAREIGVTLSLPSRTIRAECPISELADWKLELEKWASEHNGEALQLAKDTCTALHGKTVDMKVVGSSATPQELEKLRQSVERKVFKAVAAGCQAFGSSRGIVHYLVTQAEKFKSKVINTDSTFHARDIYLNAAKKAEKLAAVLDATGAFLDMNKYAEALEAMSEIERETPSNNDIAGLGDLAAEHAAFEKFSGCVKELVACFPAGEKGVAQARAMVSSCLDPMNNKVRLRLSSVCEQCLNAQRRAEQRLKRTIPTPITGILDQLARRHEVELKAGKTDAESRDYESQATITGFQDLPDAARKSLMGKAAALFRESEDRPAVYSSNNVGFGIRPVTGADTLAASVQKRVGGTIDKINELAAVAGMEARIDSLGATTRYLVSELVALQEKLNAWAQANPYVMDLDELEAELARLATRKSSTPEAIQQTTEAVTACLEKVIIACVDGGGNPSHMLSHLNTQAQGWRRKASVSAQVSCDCIIKQAGLMAASAQALQELQSGQPALVPQLTGEQMVVVAKGLKPFADYCVDESTSKQLDNDKFDELYFEAALVLGQIGVQFGAIPNILRQYNPGMLLNPKSRVAELEKYMVHLDNSDEMVEDKVHAARKFSSLFKSIQSCSTEPRVNYAQLDRAITDGIAACAASGMTLEQSVQLLKAGLSGVSLVVTSRLQAYLDTAGAITESAGYEVCVDPGTLCNVVQSLGEIKAMKELDEKGVKTFDRAYCKAFQAGSAAGLSPEQVASLIQGQVSLAGNAGVGALLEEMAGIQPFLPVPHPITIEYVEMARESCVPMKQLMQAGESIEQFDQAVEAINGLVVVVVQHPQCADSTSVMQNLEEWISQEASAGAGHLFQPVNAGLTLSRLTQGARYYDKELKVVTGEACALCEEFEDKLEEHARPESVSKFNIQKWVDLKGMTPELKQAYISRAMQSPHNGIVDMPKDFRGGATVVSDNKSVVAAVTVPKKKDNKVEEVKQPVAVVDNKLPVVEPVNPADALPPPPPPVVAPPPPPMAGLQKPPVVAGAPEPDSDAVVPARFAPSRVLDAGEVDQEEHLALIQQGMRLKKVQRDQEGKPVKRKSPEDLQKVARERKKASDQKNFDNACKELREMQAELAKLDAKKQELGEQQYKLKRTATRQPLENIQERLDALMVQPKFRKTLKGVLDKETEVKGLVSTRTQLMVKRNAPYLADVLAGKV